MNKKLTDKFTSNLIKKVGYTSKKFCLIEPDDKILIGVSGGKDSLFLIEALADRISHLPYKVELIACHISIGEVGYKVDKVFLEQMCERLGVTFLYDSLSVSLTSNPDKAPCFVCSWHRRKRLFEIAKERGCNKLALGHHADDAIETLLLNMTFHGSISSLPQKLSMFGGRMFLIRPLIELTNAELKQAAEIKQYPKLKSTCPFGDDTKRIRMREIVESIAALNKNARKNILRSMSKINPEYLVNEDLS
jgi:tRNA 2-thiocytidine biosynthesis protein TtcA